MAPFTVECQLEPRGDKWNPFGTPDSNSVDSKAEYSALSSTRI